MIDVEATFCLFYQKDHEDRERNLDINLQYLVANYSNIEIFVIQQLIDENDYYANDHLPIFRFGKIYHFPLGEPTEHWNKMSAYNFGLKHASNEVIFFNDVDTIFNPNNIKKSFELIKNEDKLMIPSGPEFVDVKLPLINSFKHEKEYRHLYTQYQEFRKEKIRENNLFCMNNVGGVGGGISGRVDTFKKYNGFNPNFKGWGYEDDETKLRYRRLGYDLEFLPGGDPIFHLFHEGAKRGSALCKYLEHNKEILESVRDMSDEEFLEYNKSWKL